MSTLQERLARLLQLKTQLSELEAERTSLEAVILRQMQDEDLKSIQFYENGIKVSASAVHGSTIKFDMDAIRQKLTTDQWQSITKQVVDNKLLEDRVARGEVPVEVIAEHSTEVPRKGYVRFKIGD